ncbi:MAG: hypothetical protein RXO24_11030 [Acidilobus sp.]
MPRLARRPGRALGAYNLLGYAASSLGAFSLPLLSRLLAGNMVEVARVTFLLYIAATASLALAYRALRGVEAPAGQAARAGLSQMDVPTRQAFMAEIFVEEERVRAFAMTNTFRSLAGLPGPLLVGAMLSSGLLAMPLLTSGLVKLGYDGAIYLIYKDRAK